MVHTAKILERETKRSSDSSSHNLSLIREAISELSEEDYHNLKEWMEEEEDFDRELEQAAKSGALDFLIDEVEEAEVKGLLAEL